MLPSPLTHYIFSISYIPFFCGFIFDFIPLSFFFLFFLLFNFQLFDHSLKDFYFLFFTFHNHLYNLYKLSQN